MSAYKRKSVVALVKIFWVLAAKALDPEAHVPKLCQQFQEIVDYLQPEIEIVEQDLK